MARKKKLEEVKAIDPKDLQCGDRLVAEPLTVPIRVIIGKKKLFGGKTKPNIKDFCFMGGASIVVRMQIPETDYTEHSISRNVYSKFREIEDNEKQMIIGNVSAMITTMYKAIDESSMPDECKRMWEQTLNRLRDMNIKVLKVMCDVAGYLETVAKVLVQLSHDMIDNNWLMYGKIFEHYNFPELIREIDNSKEMLSVDLTNEEYDFDNEQERIEVINTYVNERLTDKIFSLYAYRYYISYWFNRLVKTHEILIY